MKFKWIFLFSILYFTGTAAKACDICGCGPGSYYLGILPEYHKRFIGLRYQYKTLRTHLGPFGEQTPLTTNETYQSAELWGGWNLGRRFRMLAFVPYNFNIRQSQEGRGTKSGPGDVAVMGYYQLFNHTGMLGRRLLVQSLWAGAGIKLPVGRYSPSDRADIPESPNNFQLGTASTDFTLNAAYDIRYNDLGLNVNMNYKMNTANRYHYRYGNKLTTNVLAYYKIRIAAQTTLSPNAGLLYETSQKDIEYKKYTLDVSGGYSLSAVAGAELAMKRVSFGLNYQRVTSQQLAGARAEAGNRLMAHVSLPF